MKQQCKNRRGRVVPGDIIYIDSNPVSRIVITHAEWQERNPGRRGGGYTSAIYGIASDNGNTTHQTARRYKFEDGTPVTGYFNPEDGNTNL